VIKARVITCSDGVSSGHREDRSGPAVREILEKNGYQVDTVMVVPDDIEAIATAIEDATGDGARLVVTTGGTGIAPRDVTPEATMRVCERVIPGFGECGGLPPLSRRQLAAGGRGKPRPSKRCQGTALQRNRMQNEELRMTACFRSAAACRRFHAGSLLPAAAASRGRQSGAKAPHSKRRAP